MASVTWRKSSYSSFNGNCLEWRFRKSSRSGGANCTEAAVRGGAVLVRDSKDPDGPILEFTPAEWDEFITQLRAG